jgi:hypothetical protein
MFPRFLFVYYKTQVGLLEWTFCLIFRACWDLRLTVGLETKRTGERGPEETQQWLRETMMVFSGISGLIPSDWLQRLVV